MTLKKNTESKWFGYTQVSPAEKTKKVIDVFDSVADRYDLMNDVMSGGIHRLWKNKFVRLMNPHKDKSLLDVAGGTGDIAFRYRKAAGEEAKITVCDLNAAMLRVGKKRAIDRGYVHGIDWIEGNAERLPFDSRSFDLYSISFGLRNVTHIDDALSEAYRVLKPGGQFFCLEFSQVQNATLQKIYEAYSFKLIPTFGAMIAQDSESYQYLAESIRKFPTPENLSNRLLKAGFDTSRFYRLSNGIACMHVANKF